MTGLFCPPIFSPDFFPCSALLWHRLMGTKVLATTFNGTNKIRAYAHCAKDSVRNSAPFRQQHQEKDKSSHLLENSCSLSPLHAHRSARNHSTADQPQRQHKTEVTVSP